ncbi:MAG: EscU/YscU/HrcU family type III secretion system export apparatus switch protein [Deltaproteobacteria bacterium]|nr:EscU/YscU/HrcU family type III secretion system export apparatus switch protein [Deltaproteobacteria bacterium]
MEGADKKRIKQKQSVALRYRPEKERAPRVVAKGKGHLAEKIIEIAKKHGVPIKYEPDLVQILSKLDLEQEVPPSLYRAVAEIFAFVYKLNHNYRRPT